MFPVPKISCVPTVVRQKGQEIPDFLSNYTMLDIETTGLSPYRDRITELGAVKVRNGQIVDQYTNLIKFPKNNKVPAFINTQVIL